MQDACRIQVILIDPVPDLEQAPVDEVIVRSFCSGAGSFFYCFIVRACPQAALFQFIVIGDPDRKDRKDPVVIDRRIDLVAEKCRRIGRNTCFQLIGRLVFLKVHVAFQLLCGKQKIGNDPGSGCQRDLASCMVDHAVAGMDFAFDFFDRKRGKGRHAVLEHIGKDARVANEFFGKRVIGVAVLYFSTCHCGMGSKSSFDPLLS